MSKNLESVIHQIEQDYRALGCSKDMLLAYCVKNRLVDQSKFYNSRFDAFISRLEQDFEKENDLVRTAKILKNYSNLISKLYTQLINEVERYQLILS